MKISITKYPYIFYIFQSLNIDTFDNKITIKEKEYFLEKKNISIFLLIKYIPIFLFLSIVVNQYDFSLANEKILQYVVVIIMMVLFLTLKKIGTAINFLIIVSIGVLGVFNVLPTENFDVAYVVKYFAILYIVYQMYLDSKLEFYFVKSTEKLIGQLIVNREDIN